MLSRKEKTHLPKSFLPTAICLTAITSCGFLAFNSLKKERSTDSGLPHDIARDIQIISRISEDGNIYNGLWVSRTSQDQSFVDSCHNVHKSLYGDAPLGRIARNILSGEVQSVIAGINRRTSNEHSVKANDLLLVGALEDLNSKLTILSNSKGMIEIPLDKRERHTIANLIDRYCFDLRLTQIDEIKAAYHNSTDQLDRAQYFGIPNFDSEF